MKENIILFTIFVIIFVVTCIVALKKENYPFMSSVPEGKIIHGMIDIPLQPNTAFNVSPQFWFFKNL